MSRVQMFCAGLSPQGYPGYNAHPGAAPYIQVVPFLEAITNPPRCSLHDAPYLTTGGYRLAKVAREFARTGDITADCRLDFGSEQAAWCHPHGWAGRAGETFDDRCPHQLIAAWIVRRHEAGAQGSAA